MQYSRCALLCSPPNTGQEGVCFLLKMHKTKIFYVLKYLLEMKISRSYFKTKQNGNGNRMLQLMTLHPLLICYIFQNVFKLIKMGTCENHRTLLSAFFVFSKLQHPGPLRHRHDVTPLLRAADAESRSRLAWQESSSRSSHFGKGHEGAQWCGRKTGLDAP